ncbi:MAG: excinuclease ABC subunit UvrB [Chloroflexi bacterium]|nr:excinuclease ABC subunit UvrB [Chloroflexota bacterium]
MARFQLVSEYKPAGDQPKAIEQLTEGVENGEQFQTLLGVTGSGKTFTMANVINNVQKTTLVLAPNKTLAAQLCAEFREYFPNNAVEYFVSYYDYYQPEAYMPHTDTYIEKDTDINEEIEKLRLSATRSLYSRSDVIVVASVSCIYGIGSPEDYGQVAISLKMGETYNLSRFLRRLAGIQYERNDINFIRGKFRVRGDVVEIFPAYDDFAYRLEFFGDELERIVQIDPLTGEITETLGELDIYPARHYVTPAERLMTAVAGIEVELQERLDDLISRGKDFEAARLRQRTRFDLEMLREVGHCTGIENYSRHISGRAEGEPPWVLLDYLPDDHLIIVDESHVAMPQVRGMLAGDRSRKQSLVEYGFRLPSAFDNRPLSDREFLDHVSQCIFTSATPSDLEYRISSQVVEQIVRPTGLVDPGITVKPTKGQIDDLLSEIHKRVEVGERVLVTTLTKRMAEDLSDFLTETGVKVNYLHSEVDTLDRIEILTDLRRGVYDVVVGINLLREGLDLPEVSLVAILDADKEGYLRSEVSLIQTIGRAARNVRGHVIMYADRVTGSMKRAIDETYRRRTIQITHNRDHGITAETIQKSLRDIRVMVDDELRAAEPAAEYEVGFSRIDDLSPREAAHRIRELEEKMRLAADALEFERAAEYRDEISALRDSLELARS